MLPQITLSPLLRLPVKTFGKGSNLLTPGTQVGHFGRGPDFGRIPCGVPGATSEAPPRLQRASLVQGAARVAEGVTGGSRGWVGGTWEVGGGHLGGRVTRASSSVALTVALGGPYATQRPLFNSFKPIFRQFSGIFHLSVYM